MIKKEALESLEEIMRRDYHALISDEQVEELAISLLRLTRVTLPHLERLQTIKDDGVVSESPG
jgi:hypothetical protein